ncbi:MAG: epoxyqueuosine reductase QueH [Oscillospiraceae bacterium]|nr:epoxyqueuosine reductase QueH [Oscillospiraceae bacterium]
MNKTPVLLHVCCAPCSVACVRLLRDEGAELLGFWYNPNIHPSAEYAARRDALTGYAASAGLPLVTRGEYGLRAFLASVPADRDARCAACYAMRLDAAARTAAEHGCGAFTTTLLISPYQRHERIAEAAEAAAERHGVAFLYRDFRPAFREGQNTARQLGLYRQKYCGCVFSREERQEANARRLP